MPTRFPTAVLALVRRGDVADELRLVIATNTGRELDDRVIYARDFDAGALAEVERHLTEAGLQHGGFEGSARSGWRAIVQPIGMDSSRAQD